MPKCVVSTSLELPAQVSVRSFPKRAVARVGAGWRLLIGALRSADSSSQQVAVPQQSASIARKPARCDLGHGLIGLNVDAGAGAVCHCEVLH